MKAILTSKYFWQIPPEPYAGYNVVLDIDGTIVADSDESVREEVAAAVYRWKSVSDVVLFSNSVMKERNLKIAQELGVGFLQTTYSKPDKRLVGDLPKGKLLLIGDKMLTDGMTAFYANSEYIQVARVVSGKESLYVKLLYFFDLFFTKGFLIGAKLFGFADVAVD